MAVVLTNLGELFAEQGKYEEAEPLYNRSLEIYEKALGADSEHPAVAEALLGLGNLYRDQQRFSDAEPLYERALSILSRTLESDHSDLVELREDYAVLLLATGRDVEAEALLAQNSGN